MYAVVDANGVLTGWTDSKSQATVLTTDEDGMLQISGLDEGTYFLQETQAKSGYNTPEDPFRITISAPTDEAVNNYGETKDAYTLGTVTVSVDKGDAVDGASGVVTAQILNGKGTLLPTTGGKGVWILYGVGAALVAAAAFLQYRSRRS
jgi:LPXTG-motif cell wall-anchored protein